MTREELFRAIGEVREDLLLETETAVVKKRSRLRRRLGVLAACLVVAVTAVSVPQLQGRDQWKAIIENFDPSVEEDRWPPLILPFHPSETDSGGRASIGSLDGSDYQSDGEAQPAPNYSVGADIGELSGPGDGETMLSASSCAVWLSPEEILTQDTVIFRGIIREMRYFVVTVNGWDKYYTRALVEVTESLRGDLAAGEICGVAWLGARGYMSTSLSGPLDQANVGSEAVFMPIRTAEDTGWREGNSYFCYADLAELFLPEGMRYVFLDAGTGLDFARDVYTDIAEAETLDDVTAYLRETLARSETGKRSEQG